MSEATAPTPHKRGEPRPSADKASSHTLLEGRLGYTLEPALLVRALTHRSFAYENGGLPTNERLEFLGDSVLGLVVTDTLYRTHPDLPEGQLAKLRAAVVNSRALAEVARGLELGRFIRLGRGEEGTGGRDKASILAEGQVRITRPDGTKVLANAQDGFLSMEGDALTIVAGNAALVA